MNLRFRFFPSLLGKQLGPHCLPPRVTETYYQTSIETELNVGENDNTLIKYLILSSLKLKLKTF